jgi:phosphatidylglycerol lysyltransferase
LLGLGDPMGEDNDRVSAIWRLRDLARQEGVDAAVWRAGPEFLKIYADLGLTALPLGADGLLLPESDGDSPRAEHYLVCVAERDLKLLLPVLPKLAQAHRPVVTAPV